MGLSGVRNMSKNNGHFAGRPVKSGQELRDLHGNFPKALSPSRPEQPIRLRRGNQIIRNIELVRVGRAVSIHNGPSTSQPMYGHRVRHGL